jgi:uncharacterized membrane protein YfcA
MAGALIGSKVLARARVRWLRIIFAVTVAASGVQLVLRAIRGEV